MATVMTATLAGSVPSVLSQSGVAGAAAVGPMRSVPCGPLPGDPPLEAPGYAQQAGASGAADAWWCQLPHATVMPARFAARQRYVSPLSGALTTYASYATEYVIRGQDGKLPMPTTGPTIIVSSDVNSTVAPPGHLPYKAPSYGVGKVTVANGVTGVLAMRKNIVSVTWKFPTRAVPRYLRGVVSVSVSGSQVSKSTILAVARMVKPD